MNSKPEVMSFYHLCGDISSRPSVDRCRYDAQLTLVMEADLIDESKN